MLLGAAVFVLGGCDCNVRPGYLDDDGGTGGGDVGGTGGGAVGGGAAGGGAGGGAIAGGAGGGDDDGGTGGGTSVGGGSGGGAVGGGSGGGTVGGGSGGGAVVGGGAGGGAGGGGAGGGAVGGGAGGGAVVGGGTGGGIIGMGGGGGAVMGGGAGGGIVSIGGGMGGGTGGGIVGIGGGGGAVVGGGTGGGTMCPPGVGDHLYVDKSAATGGNGTLACPFTTILAASSLPLGGLVSRTIHVKGNTIFPDYTETAPIILAAGVTLTSNYDSTNTGGVAQVRVIARGACNSVSGAASFCAVGMNNGSRLELMTVRVTNGASTGHAIVTSNVATTPSAIAPVIVDVQAENAPEAGIRGYGSVDIGPRVRATGNATGLLVNTPSPAAVRPIVHIRDAATSPGGAPTNAFDFNRANGAAISGDLVLIVDGASFSTNGGNGLNIATDFQAGVAAAVQTLANVHVDTNNLNGLRVASGDVRVLAFAGGLNTFSNNGTGLGTGTGGYGIESNLGDSLGGARLTLDPAAGGAGARIAHQANNNKLGGVHLNQVTPVGVSPPHALSSLEAINNGGITTSSSGVFVQIAGANSPNQPSVVIRGSRLTRNSAAGLRFQKGNANTLDIGGANSPGQNIFDDGVVLGKNGKAAVCYENATSNAVTQSVETNRWSSATVCTPSFVPNVVVLGNNGCSSNLTYADFTNVNNGGNPITYTSTACF